MYNESLLESLVQKIYEAAIGTIGWVSFLVCLSTAMDGMCPALFSIDPMNLDGSIGVSVDINEKQTSSYKTYYAERNIWAQRAQAAQLLKPGLVRASQMLCSRREFLRSEYYSDFCRPLGFTQSIGLTILQQGSLVSNIGLFRSDHQAPYDEEDFALMRALFPHLKRGLQMHLHLVTSQARGQAFEAVLNGLPTPVLLVTGGGRVIFMNTAAERLVRASDGLTVERGELRALLPNDTKSLRTLIGGAAQSSVSQTTGTVIAVRRDPKPGGTLQVSRPYGRQPLEVLISPLPTSQEEWILRQPPVAAIFVTDRSRVMVAEDSMLTKLHGLTAMEVKVARAVSRGLSGKEICRDLEISYNTLKTHLKHIYAKTRTRHQSDLVRFLAEGVQIAAAGERENS